MLEGRHVVRFDGGHTPHLIDIAHAIGMNDDLVTPGEITQVKEGARFSIRKVNMRRDDTVTLPGRVGGFFQPASLTPQPGEIPGSALLMAHRQPAIGSPGWVLQPKGPQDFHTWSWS